VLKADWNNAFFSELEGFDGKRSNSSKKDDQVDPTSDCFNILATKKELPKLNARKLRMS
jgi:phage terminase large subunit-like protein